jgi:pSer/pThr/pTyr-binding forkhead associated (FHA) protein
VSRQPAESLPVLHIELTYRGASRSLELRDSVLGIGRRSSNHPAPQIAVDDPTVSRSQAEIRWLGKNYWITDLGSLTGTYFNGERLAPGDRMPLSTGVMLRFGQTTADIRIERQQAYGEVDVFLCHSNADKSQVRQVARELRMAGLNPWLEEDEHAASAGFFPQLSSALKVIGAALVLWGPNSPGRRQAMEIEFLQKAAIEEGVLIIPVILEGVERDPEWSAFMDRLQGIDFRHKRRDAMAQLVATLRS